MSQCCQCVILCVLGICCSILGILVSESLVHPSRPTVDPAVGSRLQEALGPELGMPGTHENPNTIDRAVGGTISISKV